MILGVMKVLGIVDKGSLHVGLNFSLRSLERKWEEKKMEYGEL